MKFENKKNFKVAWFPPKGKLWIACNNLYILLSDEIERLDNCEKKKKSWERQTEAWKSG